ncbi:MAG: hypothetical protein ACR2NM_01350 [Bythopirellula sp.]
MDRWDVLIIAAAGYIAAMTLVRLMAARRNQLVDQVRQQVEQQRSHQPAESATPAAEDAGRGAA